MKAVLALRALPSQHPESLVDAEIPEPVPSGRDLRVAVRAISVNPVDTKIRAGLAPDSTPRLLGWDAAGVVEAVGPEATLFRPGDRVWYAGDLTRPGSYAEKQLVDERIVGAMPNSLEFAHAAALPLTAITAWELLFDRLALTRGAHEGESLLVVGAAGGVGSILLQMARRLTGLRVIGTASRPETREWALKMGAHHVIDHAHPMAGQLTDIGLGEVDHVISLTHTDSHLDQLVGLLRPQGKLALIDDPVRLDATKLKRKSQSLHWEFMFTRPMFRTGDMTAQHTLLCEVARLVDEGVLASTATRHAGPVTAANLRAVHAELESGRTRGKIVLEGFA
ncbi:zinc-binding alcohol dehydrogenase family protein [Paludibacterium paludis]|uniref:Zinc-type alcohol dehydrogenase-like protein n=1 Tax=Paludibacterium paludis TaxID=1225769 RepID=A0A918UAV2_9NEIS|nr:zinc-binding alcohol dehydrogenase family protein [Paludibacterium paludis]GGY24923.1 oxidoreductase [Paludibacterium paludis]